MGAKRHCRIRPYNCLAILFRIVNTFLDVWWNVEGRTGYGEPPGDLDRALTPSTTGHEIVGDDVASTSVVRRGIRRRTIHRQPPLHLLSRKRTLR